jgi:hypothetical protein
MLFGLLCQTHDTSASVQSQHRTILAAKARDELIIATRGPKHPTNFWRSTYDVSVPRQCWSVLAAGFRRQLRVNKQFLCFCWNARPYCDIEHPWRKRMKPDTEDDSCSETATDTDNEGSLEPEGSTDK